MKKYILARKGWSWASGKTLAQYFREHGRNIWVTENPDKDIVVNWGNSACRNALLNPHIITNKLRQLEVLHEGNIPVLEVFRNNPPEDATIVARKRNHQAGNDIIVVNPGEPIPVSEYYTRFERFNRELRIHAFRTPDNINTRGFKKILDGEEEENPIRNLTHGYGFRLVSLSEELVDLVDRTLVLLQLDFGCLDVGVKREGQKYTIIEVNSAPSLVNNETSLQWYANNIGNRIFEDWEDISA
jgi:hypothetical protein